MYRTTSGRRDFVATSLAPRIIVTTDPIGERDDTPVLLDESVHSLHLSDDHAAER